MISAILLIQNVATSQQNYVSNENLVTKVIYLTYGVTGVYISAVAIMAAINIAR